MRNDAGTLEETDLCEFDDIYSRWKLWCTCGEFSELDHQTAPFGRTLRGPIGRLDVDFACIEELLFLPLPSSRLSV